MYTAPLIEAADFLCHFWVSSGSFSFPLLCYLVQGVHIRLMCSHFFLEALHESGYVYTHSYIRRRVKCCVWCIYMLRVVPVDFQQSPYHSQLENHQWLPWWSQPQTPIPRDHPTCLEDRVVPAGGLPELHCVFLHAINMCTITILQVCSKC